MFVEYYSQAGPARPGDPPVTGKGFAAWVNGNFPIWTREIASAIDALSQNPEVERDRIALIGHSLGAFLALAVGASEGGRVAAVIEYYGALTNTAPPMVANMPPTLILHGSADRTILAGARRDAGPGLTEWRKMFLELLQQRLTPAWADENAANDAYERHNAAVRAVAPRRFLRWQATDGWEPLCRALGVPVPDQPFPHFAGVHPSVDPSRSG